MFLNKTLKKILKNLQLSWSSIRSKNLHTNKCHTNKYTYKKFLIIPGRVPLALLAFGSRDVSFYLYQLLVFAREKFFFRKNNFQNIFLCPILELFFPKLLRNIFISIFLADYQKKNLKNQKSLPLIFENFRSFYLVN